MASLNISLLLLANFVLLDYRGKLFYERFLEWQANRKLIGNHPEMLGVDLEQDNLVYFKADQAIRDVVLDNKDCGTNDHFLGDLFLMDEDGF